MNIAIFDLEKAFKASFNNNDLTCTKNVDYFNPYGWTNSIVKTKDNGYLVSSHTSYHDCDDWMTIYSNDVIKISSEFNIEMKCNKCITIDDSYTNFHPSRACEVENNYITTSYNYLFKIAPDGSTIWKKELIQDANKSTLYYIKKTTDQGYLVLGTVDATGLHFAKKYDKQDQLEYTKMFNFDINNINDMIQLEDQSWYLYGNAETINGTFCGWFAKVDKNWNMVWECHFDYFSGSNIYNVIPLQDNLFLACGSINDEEAWLVKFSLIDGKLSAPEPIEPVPNKIGTGMRTWLHWKAVDGADSYQLQVDSDADFSSPLLDRSGITSNRLLVQLTKENNTYNWRVRAKNSSYTSEWSAPQQFTTMEYPGIVIEKPTDFVLYKLDEKDHHFIDREYYISDLPSELENLIWIKTAMDYKTNTSNDCIKFYLEQGQKVYIAFQEGTGQVPDWLRLSFNKTYLTIQDIGLNNNKGTYTIYEKYYEKGFQTLGGPRAPGAYNIYGMYLIAFENKLFSESKTEDYNITWVHSNSIWGDYDNDGDLDNFTNDYTQYNGTYVPAREPSNTLYINDIFFKRSDYYVSFEGYRYCDRLTWADDNKDGLLDLIAINYNNYVPSLIYLNNGDGTFTCFKDPDYPEKNNLKVWGDYDNDGDMDYAMLNDAVYRNDGNDLFTKTNIDLTEANRACWGDYNSDGYLDLLISGPETNNSKILKNQTNGTFYPINLQLFKTYKTGSVCWGDADNDGDLDILTHENIFQNLGNDSFKLFSSHYHIYQATWGDFDNNGVLDILPTEYDTYPFLIYRNNCMVINEKPSAPTNLSANAKNSTVTLSWNRAADDKTPAAGLTYNIYVGTKPGTCNIVAPESDMVTGYRRKVKMGNVNHNIQWPIHNLDPGTYYWSVQAVDAAYAGSKFAPEQSFIINSVVPVELTDFQAKFVNGQVQLSWATVTETNNYGFDIEQKIDDNWQKIGFVEGNSTTTSTHHYQFDCHISSSTPNLEYRLKQIDFDGSCTYSQIVSIENNVPKKFELCQNYPNPFNPTTTINYSLAKDGWVTLTIYNPLGEQVKTLVSKQQSAGQYQISFDAGNMSSGMYFYQLKTGSFTDLKKMLLLR